MAMFQKLKNTTMKRLINCISCIFQLIAILSDIVMFRKANIVGKFAEYFIGSTTEIYDIIEINKFKKYG